jgi:hypothetical protein
MTVINLSGISDEFTPLDNGRYKFYVADYKKEVVKPPAKSAGADMYNVEFHIDNDEHPDYKNRRTWRRLVITDEALPFVKQLLVRAHCPPEAMGFNSKTEEWGDFDLDKAMEAIKGAPVYIDLSVEEYEHVLPNGEKELRYRNKIEGIVEYSY